MPLPSLMTQKNRRAMKFDRRLWRQVPEVYAYLALTVGIGTLLGVLVVFQAFYLSTIINAVFLLSQSIVQVWTPLLILIGIIGLRALLSWGNALMANHVAAQVKTTLRRKLLARLFLLGPHYTRGERSGELINTLVTGVDSLDAYFSQYVPQIFLSLLVPTLIVVTIFRLDAPSGIILVIMIPVLFFLLAVFGIMAGVETKRHWKALSLMSAHFLDTLQGLTTLKLFGRSTTEEKNIRLVSERFRQTTMATLRIAFFSSFILEEGATISAAIIAVEVGLRLLTGQMPFQTALYILLLTPEFFLPLRLLGTRYHAGMTGSVAIQRMIDILETPVPSRSQECQQTFPIESERMPEGSICLEHVSYAYSEGRPALRDVSCFIPPGQKVALVGPSGAGKSTLAHILLRFLEPDSGRVSISGKTTLDLSPQEWRKQIAWVPQHPYLFYATVADNIRLGYPEATDAQVREAARQAFADTFIEALPEGYDTLIGERGTRLSGGEAQRVSLARAFLKNAPILLLDEATSYLDPEHEAQVLEGMARLERGRTVLIIAHRLSTIYQADQIIVLDGGQIVETGTHQALSQRSGLYHQFIRLYQQRNS